MAIIDEILPGVRQALTGDADRQPDPGRCLVVPDRREAIGRALALRMAADGWIVATSARTLDNLSSLAAECPTGRIHACPD